ncbi:YncE family protein [Rufibacter psychrotolerans]|uniref:YncE family protein n=1 Tax=Rufibacter psychrotolerans TaxID=2812556 RepID=UPI0019676A1F|nr:DUF5074 domain-containing protein [Rufibacter sp. SYSU D00308]
MKRLLFSPLRLGVFSLAALFLASSCQEEKKEVLPTYQAGVLIANAGSQSGTISFYDRATGTVEPDLFAKVNGRALAGNVLTMASAFERMYLVTSNGTVEALLANTFTATGTMDQLESPQAFAALNNRRAFISDWLNPADSGRVVELDLGTFQVTDTVKTGKTPGAMAVAGNRLFVANAASNQVNVINTVTNTMEASLTVGDNPNSLVVDGSGNLWVLCGGSPNATRGQLIRFSASNLSTAPVMFPFPNAAVQPHGLTLSASRNRLYFLADGVYVLDLNAVTLPEAPLIRRRFQAMGQDPADGLLYFSKAVPGANGWVVRYRSTGAALDSFQVQGTPTGFGFR